jgi:hypothetical protein
VQDESSCAALRGICTRSPQWSRAHHVSRPLVAPPCVLAVHTCGAARELAAPPSVLTALWSRSPSSPRRSPLKPLVALPSAFATHARSARSQLAASLSARGARLSHRLPPWPRMHACSAGSQLAVPPSVLAAHARLVALRAHHILTPETRAVLYAGSVLASALSLPTERRISRETAARVNGAERQLAISTATYPTAQFALRFVRVNPLLHTVQKKGIGTWIFFTKKILTHES